MRKLSTGLFLICGLLLRAQTSTDGAIAGAITDPSKAVVAGADVVARNPATNASAATKTDENGRYSLIHLQPGVYELEVKANGLATAKIAGITVEVGRPTPVDVTLAVAGTAESVTVAAEAPVINTEQQDFATNINQTSIDNLPINGRRWFSFALGTPGTATDGGFGDISFRGISGLLNNNTVDGGDNNQAFFSEEKGRTRIAYSTSQESIREFQVNTAAYSAEYGRAAGGVVNAVTKSGTNALHGDVFYYNRDSSFGAYTPFATQPALVNSTYIQVPIKPLDIRQQFGGDLGGALIKNKLFFYYNFDMQVRHFPAVATPSNPAALFGPLTTAEITTLTSRLGPGTKANLSAAQITQDTSLVFNLFQHESGTVPRTGNQVLNFPKLDWRFNSNNTVTMSYNRLRWDSPYGVQTNSVVARGLDSYGDDFVKGDTGVARWVSILRPTLTNELRFQYGRDFEFEFANPPLSGVPISSVTGFSPEVDISGAAAFTWGQPTYTQRYKYPEEKRTQVADSMTWSHGKHLIKFGLDVNHVSDGIKFINNGGGDYSYNNRVDFMSDYIASQIPAVQSATGGLVCGTAAAPLQCYQSFSQALGPLGFQFSTNEYGMFVQDEWRAGSRLTLNIGLRYELELLPSPQIPNPAVPATGVFNSDKKDFGPRVGFAWDVTGNGKTSVRGGYGIYYGRIINGTIFEAITSTGVTAGQTSTTISPNTNGAIGPVYPNVIATLAGSVAKPSIIFLSGDLRNPMIHQYDLVIEHQIAANTSVSLSYLGSLGHFLPAAVDTNLPAPTTITYAISGGPLNGDSFTLPFYKGARPNSSFLMMSQIFTRITSQYNAGVFQFNRRLTQGLQVQASYTWADSVDNGQGTSPTLFGNSPLNPQNLAADRGPSNFDIRNRGAGAIIWQPPYFDHSSPAIHWLLSGWTVAPIFFVQSGLPFSPTVSGNPASGLGNTGTGTIGAQGSTRVPFLERNSFRLPRTANVDLRISRSFRVKERAKLELIGEAFNLFNHVNYTGIVAQQYTNGGTAAAPTLTYFPTFGTLNAANNNNVIGPRQIQIGARISF